MSSPTHAGIFPLDGGDGLIDWVRARARELGPEALPSLRELAVNGSIAMRSAAILSVAELDPRGAEAFIVERFDVERSHVVIEALTRSLGMLDSATSLELLRTAWDERAARIALHRRLAGAPTETLRSWIVDADRGASVALEILADRGDAGDVLLDVLKTPELLSLRFARAVVPTVDHRALLLAIAETPFDEDDDELPAALAALAIRCEASLVFDVMAPVVRASLPLARPIVNELCAQLDRAWMRPEDHAIGFDDGDAALGPLPDARWFEIMRTLASAEDWLLGSYVPGFDPNRPTPALRGIESGAEDGQIFVLAGFDVKDLSMSAVEEVAERFGPRTKTNLHWVQHQYAGYSCRQAHLVGIPLSSPEMREHFDAEHPTAVLPGSPAWTDGEEALVATEPTYDGLCAQLEGLPVVRMLPNAAPWRPLSGFWVYPHDTMMPRGSFGRDDEELLLALGRALDLGAPRLFVLWANSD